MLPEDLQTCMKPLLDALPLEQAMSALVVTNGNVGPLVSKVEKLVAEEPFSSNAPLAAGLWLYIDDLDRSHGLSQDIKTQTGSYWHGIMHRREGDFGNSHYWFDRTGRHPAMAVIENYDPHRFIDDVAEAYRHPAEELIALQRREWAALMAWCHEHP